MWKSSRVCLVLHALAQIAIYHARSKRPFLPAGKRHLLTEFDRPVSKFIVAEESYGVDGQSTHQMTVSVILRVIAPEY